MDLRPFLQDIDRQLEAAAEAGGEETRAIAERLVGPLESAIRLALLDALAAAAEEITVELAPGSVELRLRGRDPEFVVTAPSVEPPAEDPAEDDDVMPGGWPAGGAVSPAEGDEAAISRINLRLPAHLKARIEEAASSDGLSINSWLVHAAAAALGRADSVRRRARSSRRGARRYTGWVR